MTNFLFFKRNPDLNDVAEYSLIWPAFGMQRRPRFAKEGNVGQFRLRCHALGTKKTNGDHRATQGQTLLEV